MRLSIVIPAYNEENRIGKTIRRIRDYIKEDYELIVVNDCSTDNTLKILKNLKVNVLNNKSRRGKGFSVRRGFLHCKGDYALISDADLSTPISEIEKLKKYLPEYDIAIASRKKKDSKITEKQPIWRIFAGNIFPILVRLLLIGDIKDTQCGFKLFNVSKCKEIFEKQTLDGFCYDVEILFNAKKHNLRIKEIGVHWNNDSETKLNLVKDSVRMFVDLIKIRVNNLRGLYN